MLPKGMSTQQKSLSMRKQTTEPLTMKKTMFSNMTMSSLDF